jgi:cellulose synthase/poly-beta-1,6-N-acetylglucosamine synthase-like glycosyltransferase
MNMQDPAMNEEEYATDSSVKAFNQHDRVSSSSSTGSAPLVTVMIPTKNNVGTIEECIRSIRNLDYPQNRLEIIVIDAHSTDGTTELLGKSGVRLILDDSNPSTAYNKALPHARGEFIAFVDSDARVQPLWLAKLLREFEDPRVAAAGGNILTWNEERILPRWIGHELTYRYSRMPRNIRRIATTTLLVRRSVLEEIGGFDERLDTGYDAKLGFDIADHGYRMVFSSDAVVYHYHRPSLSSFFRQQYRYARNDILRLRYGNLNPFKDNVTSVWMFLQPILISIAMLLILLGFVIVPLAAAYAPYLSRQLALFGLLLLLGLTLWFFAWGVRLAVQYGDITATVGVPLLMFVRALAWVSGGLVGLSYLLVRELTHKSDAKA